jgi:phosphoenolpyruvate carboxykinase (GTP)
MRVLKWIVDRVEGKASGTEHVFGVSPRYEDMEWQGLEFPRAKFDAITSIDLDDWRREIQSHSKLFAKLAGRLPSALDETRCKFAHRLGE